MTQARPRDLLPWEARYVYAGVVPHRLRRSAAAVVESEMLAAMVRAGWSRDAAWVSVRASHPAAFPALRVSPEVFASGWLGVGGPVSADLVSEAQSSGVADEVAAAVIRVWGMLHMIPRRSRPRAVRIAFAVLAWCLRDGVLRVRVPLRSVQLATGIRGRGAVVAGLRDAALLLGQLHEVFDPLRPLDSSHELEILPADPGVVVSGPLGITHPLPALTAGPSATSPDWSAALADAPLVWAGLLSVGGVASISDLAGLVAAGDPSRQTTRTVEAVVTGLVEAGLVEKTGGRVRVSDSSELVASEALIDTIHRERAEWVARCNRRDAARIARARARLARHAAWWDGLSPDEREARRQARAAGFQELPISEQAELRERWEARRAAAGIRVGDAHRAWCHAHVTPERRQVRRSMYRANPPQRRRELVASWVAWREARGITRFLVSRQRTSLVVSQVVPPVARPFPTSWPPGAPE